MNRRRFIQLAGTSVAAVSLVASCRSSSRARTRADGTPIARYRRERDQSLRVACIGVGGRGLESLQELLAQCDAAPDPQFVEVAALCDVDLGMLDAAATRIPTARRYRDFRLLFHDLQAGAIEFDAVMVSTPDHTHAFATALALSCGLPVYCEKPLTHSIEEARKIAAMARRFGVPTQMGNQIHADSNYRNVVELIRSGAIGEVSFADCMEGKSWCCGAETPGAVAPETLDWNLWQGPTPESAYIKDIAPANWRRYWKYGNGTLGDMACHILDLPFWALGLADKGGLRAEIRADGPPPDAVGCPKSLEISWALTWFGRDKQRDPLILRWFDGGRPSPTLQELSSKNKQDYSRFSTLFQGSKGFLLANYDEYLVLPQALAETITIPPAVLARPAGHQREWMDSVRAWTMDLPRSAAPTSSDFTYASKLTEMVLSGTIAYRAQAPISYDFVRGSVSGAGSVAATALLATPCRSGWSLERCDFDRDIGASVG